MRSKYLSKKGSFWRTSFLTRGTSPKKKTAKRPAAAPNPPAMVPLPRYHQHSAPLEFDIFSIDLRLGELREGYAMPVSSNGVSSE